MRGLLEGGAVDVSIPYHQRLVQRFLQYVDFHEDGFWEWTGALESTGYGQFGVRENGVSKPIRAHRMSWQIWRGEVPENHRIQPCDKHGRLCVNPDDLLPWEVGRKSPRFQRKARKVRELLESQPERRNITLQSIGNLFGVTREAIRLVIEGTINGSMAFGELDAEDCEIIKRLYAKRRRVTGTLAGEAIGLRPEAAAPYLRAARECIAKEKA